MMLGFLSFNVIIIVVVLLCLGKSTIWRPRANSKSYKLYNLHLHEGVKVKVFILL